jgi:HemY protein
MGAGLRKLHQFRHPQLAAPETPEIASATGAHMLPLLRSTPVAEREDADEAELVEAEPASSDAEANGASSDTEDGSDSGSHFEDSADNDKSGK